MAVSYLLVFIQFACLGYLLQSGPILVGDPFGALAQFVGIFLGFWAIYSMRRSRPNITPEVSSKAVLITDGPYQYIRHPMYTALLITTLPMLIEHYTPQRLFTWVVLVIDLLLKIRREETLLAAHFPDYAAYRETSRKLVPFVY